MSGTYLRGSVRDTSMEVYVNKVLQDISKRQVRVLAMYWRFPNEPFTNNEMSRKMTQEDYTWAINQFTPRRGELVDMGLLEEVIQRPCRQSGNKAWAVGLTEKGKQLYREAGIKDGVKILTQEKLG